MMDIRYLIGKHLCKQLTLDKLYNPNSTSLPSPANIRASTTNNPKLWRLASDRQLGVQLQTVATDFQKIYNIHDKLFIDLAGLTTNAQTLYQRLVFRHKLYQLREERDLRLLPALY